MSLKHLAFFDKNGDKLTPRVENNVFKFDVFFEQTSTGLFDSQHLFLLEEVLVEDKKTTNKYKFSKPKDTLQIQILDYLYNANDIVFKETLINQFPSISLEYEFINNFLMQNSAYIEKNYYYDREYYYLTETGKLYIEEYQEKIREYEYSNYNINVDYVRPRSSYTQKITDDINKYKDETFIFFKWQNAEYDKNIFAYLIDYNPDNLYVDSDSSVCFKNTEKFPTIVPIYNNYLQPTDENPNWKLWFTPYKFDNGRNDSYEWNREPIWNQEGYVDNEAYPKTFDKYGKRVFAGRRLLNSDSTINKKPLQFNIALHSEIEGEFCRTLEIYAIKTNSVSYDDNGEIKYKDSQSVYKIAEVTFYGEVIAEDERLELLLENFGRSVDETELNIFRDVEIDEDRPDYIKLNEKRKELLLSSNDLFPYMGSYKTFVNALKYFGFYDIRLKEYFINTILSSPKDGEIYYSAVEIPLDLKIKNNVKNKSINEFIYGELIDDEMYYKSSRFGLYYDINKLSGKYDSDGWPIVEDAYSYTNEEILLKLYGLKNILEKKYLPHNVRIINITGEGLYFAKIRVNSWSNSLPIITIDKNTNPDFVAIPRKGYIKSLNSLLNIYRKKTTGLNDTGYFDINGNYINESLNEYTKIENIIHCSLSEFSIDSDTNFQFDTELPLNIMEKFYDSYFEIKKEIYNNLHSTCENKWTKDLLTEANSHTFELNGFPTVLRLLDNSIVWDDLTIQYKYIDNDLYKTSEEIISTWDNIGKYNGYEISWLIEHIDGSYCYHKQGKIEKYEEILVFLPKIGKYSVTCTIKDNTNFPAIKKRKEYIEVLGIEPDFIAIGRCTQKEYLWRTLRSTWENTTMSWSLGYFCPIKTLWSDSTVSWDSLYYENYINQDFVKYNEEKIKSINDNEFLITGSSYYNNWLNYNKRFYRNNIVLENEVNNNNKAKYNFKIDSITSDKKIVIIGDHPIIVGDKINLHRYYNTPNFVIDDGKLIIEYSNDFEIGKNIKLKTIENKTYNYYVTNIVKNIDENKTYLELSNDGSLDELNFAKLEYNIDDTILTVINSYKNEGFTVIEVDDSKSFLYNIIRKIKSKKSNINDWRVDYKFLTGYFNFEILSCKLDKNNDTIVRVKPSQNLCEIDINFKIKYNKYEIDWALRNGTIEQINWENLTKTKFDDTKYQTWQTIDYYQEPILGFKILEYRDIGKIFFDDVEFNYDISNVRYNEKWYELANLLNSSTQKNVSLFEYFVIENKYIQATAKIGGNHALFNMSSSLGTIVTENTFSQKNYKLWEEQFFIGDNNPALFSTQKRVQYYNEKEDNALIGTFNYSDCFIKSNDINIPLFTPLFIIHDKYRNFNNLKYNWQLIDEKRNKLLIISDKNYLIWNFVEAGIYSVDLTITDEFNNTYTKSKKSWITVTEELKN